MPLLRALLVLGSVVAAHPALKLEVREPITSRVGNIHVTVDEAIKGPVRYTYGNCDAASAESADHVISISEAQSSHRLVWVVPEDAPSDGCISSWNASGDLVGRSDAVKLHHQWRRRSQKRCKSNKKSQVNHYRGSTDKLQQALILAMVVASTPMAHGLKVSMLSRIKSQVL